ncbi:unnamed protein product [Mucor hiemalis]
MRNTTTTPLSGWLNKLTTAKTFSGSRWQSRYFVLLDSEMRYYKGEHSITASRTINLRDVSKVVNVSYQNRAHCFKLEPTLYYQSQHPKGEKKVWTIECQSQHELESWVDAINNRLIKLCFAEESQADVIISPMLQPFSTPEQKRQQPLVSLTRAITSSSNISNSSSGSDITTSACEDIESQHLYTPQPRPFNRSRPTISRRRGVLLCPLDICTIPGLETSDMLSSSSSKEMSPVKPDEEFDEEENSQSRQANKVTVQNAYVLDTASPTFALYKERFHL